MPTHDAVLRLLLVDDRIEDAEQLTSLLRNGGMAVRPQRPDGVDELRQLLATQAIDLVLASISARSLPFDVVVREVQASGKDLGLLAVIEQLDDDVLLDALKRGARDVVLRGQPIQAQLIVRAEAEFVRTRRAVRSLEALLRETERRCDALINSSRDPIAYIHEGMHIRANEAYLEMFGYASFEDIEGLSALDLIAPSHAAGFKDLLKRLSKGEAPPPQLEIKAVDASGAEFDALMEFTPASYEGEACLQIVFRPQLVDASMAAELDALRHRDPLTGLANRAHFMSELERAVAAAAGGRHHQALLLVEPDNYDALIGGIGLAQADDLLKALCARLEGVLDGTTIAGRLSDHRFAVVCRLHDHKATLARAEAIRAAFHGRILEIGDRSLTLTVSVGGVQIGERNAQIDPVLSRAESSLQSAMGVGGDRVEIHDPSARDRAEEERIQAWVQRLRDALDSNGFTLHYQPIVSLSGEPGETYEAYLRLKGNGGEIIMPSTFLPLAQEQGLGPVIDRWVIHRAVAVIAERQAAGKDTTLYVKLGPESISANDQLGREIVDAVRAAGIPGGRLVLELHEPSVFTHLKAIQGFAQTLRTAGVRLALEHFGTGLNSFQLLQHIDADVIKVDRSYITDLAHNPDNQAKVREFAGRARELGKTCVVHYVQDAASMTVLFGIGVDYVEGDFLAAAGPAMNYDFG
ncbi:MAG TPA: PAS domain S-box protein [Xanthomonadaceae bacterium]|jgi:diguanylate cyclase (GGDEF)-like protein/PAS domain S-box-containing protein|nr:PAS domain S-box protein [Xanthomonadaceae bacterium]